jgi:uncharacterized phage protein gp47/JayE
VPDYQSRNQRIRVYKRGLLSVPGATIDPEAVDKKGSTLNLMAAGTSAVAEEVERRSDAKIAALTLAGARGSEVDALAEERTGGEVHRFGATPSVVPLTFTRTSFAAGGGTIAKGTKVSVGSVSFTTDLDVTFGATDLGPHTVDATSTTAGTQTAVAIGTLTSFDTAPFDPAIRVTNLEAAAGGGDVELDPSLKSRIQDWPRTVRRGTLGAIETGALTVPGIRLAVAVEVVDETGIATGMVICYVADANGQANVSLVRKVERALRAYRCGGGPVRVVGSVPLFVDIQLSIAYLAGYATEDVQDLVRSAVAAAINRLPPNSTLLHSLLIEAIRSVPGTVVPANAVRLPVGDVVPSAGVTFRTTTSRVTFV